MAKKVVDIGVTGNDGTGDSIRDAFRKVNENFDELYASFGAEGQLQFTDLSDTPDQTTISDANKIVGINASGTRLVYKTITAGDGIILTPSSNNLTITSTGGSIENDATPILGGPLSTSSNRYPIGNLPNLADNTELANAGAVFQARHPTITYDANRLAVNKGYADTKLALTGGTITGNLAVSGTTTISEPTIASHAATKNYVDNNSFASTIELFVSTTGRTGAAMLAAGVDTAKIGRGWSYAYNSLLEACQKAETIINADTFETGPYRQLITDNNATANATISTVGVSHIVLTHTAPDVDQYEELIPGKLLVGSTSGAKAILTAYTGTNNANRLDFTYLAGSAVFVTGETVEFDNPVNTKNISINLESGIYEEDYPIRLPANTSIVGTDFRRCILRPKNRISQSPYVDTWFYRDTTFDGLTTASTNYGYHYLSNPLNKNSTPKNNTELDVFLVNDATRIYNLTVQGHGGFMMVLDPEGSILTKSPYCQVGTSISRSSNEHVFAGGQYVDGFAGRMPASITSISGNDLVVQLNPAPYTHLEYRQPKTPTVFYVSGNRYQINRVSAFNNSTGVATLVMDSGTPVPSSLISSTVILETAGNKSMLANDFTQVNDLGYGIVATNNGLTEQVSTFTYYTHTGFYSVNGGQIRSINSSSAHGLYGLRAKGRDPNEVPDPITLSDDMVQVAQAYMAGDFALTSAGVNNFGDVGVTIYNFDYIPYPTCELEINHSRSGDGPTRYIVNSVEMVTDTSSPATVIAKLNLRDASGSGGEQSLIDELMHDDYVIIRSNQNFKFREVDINQPTRPSTALTFNYDENSTVYRTITYDPDYYNNADTPADPTYNSQTALPSDTAVIEFDTTFDYVAIRTADRIHTDGTGTTIRCEALTAEDATRIDSGLYEFAWVDQNVTQKGFKRKILSYAAPVGPATYGTITIDSAMPANTYIPIGEDLRAGIKASGTTTSTASIASSGAVSSLACTSTADFIDPTTLTVDPITGLVPTTSFIVSYVSSIATVARASNTVTIVCSGNHYLANGDIVDVTCTSNTSFNASKVSVTVTNATTFTYNQSGSAVGTVAATGSVEKRNNEVFTYTGITPTSFTGVTRSAYGTTPGEYPAGSTLTQIAGEIIVNISTCRATGHDFLDIGTGGYNTTNYPNNIFGSPESGFEPVSADAAIDDSGNASKAEVQEITEGRVFFTGTNQDGFYRVGRFFEVDQGTGTVTFSANIALSNLDGFGFKRGTVVREFSTDDSMGGTAGGSGDTVPVESAVRDYINRRLGLNSNGVSNSVNNNPIGPGFLPLNGALGMAGNLNMNSSYNIINLADPRVGQDQDAATANYVKTGAYTMTNKTFTDSSTTFQDEGDNSKKMKFQLSGISGTTTRTLTVPDVNGTIVTTGDTGSITSTMIANDTIVNADINSAAAIAYSKLNLSSSIVNADVSASAAIAYSKLNLGGSIVNADISNSASIANSKLANSSITVGSTSISLGGTSTSIAGVTQLDVDNLRLDGNTLSSTDTNGNINLTPNGTGKVVFTKLSAGSDSTAGTVEGDWTLTANSSFEATYAADLAEYYEADNEYEVGTVLAFGGEKEVTTTDVFGDTRVAGVVSTNAAYKMYGACPGIKTLLALQGRVPVKVIGKVRKGDILVSSAKKGYAIANNNPNVGSIIGKSLVDKLDDGPAVIEVAVGRF